jgi:dipeptidyl aminopeptidase/acylaminoacyl peptidase
VELSALDDVDERRTATNLRCERIYFAAGKGICLRREIRLFSAQTVATLVDTSLQPLFNVRIDGIPTRARISPDGRYAAFTVFVTGHSYGDAQMSTATLLLDIGTGATMANLEEFTVLQDGNVVDSLDRNYWGVTFKHDSNFFYATLRMRGVNYLVRGDVRRKTISVVHEGVECPSLSPDETRIAFKKMASRNNWRLTVLDLTTFEETPLAETASVDDQAEWLDNDHVLYAVVDPAPWRSTMVVPADGSGQPKVFAKGADSPAVVRMMPAGSTLGTE